MRASTLFWLTGLRKELTCVGYVGRRERAEGSLVRSTTFVVTSNTAHFIVRRVILTSVLARVLCFLQPVFGESSSLSDGASLNMLLI